MSAAAAALPPSVLHAALLEGAGGDLTVRAVVGLLERVGLLARTDVVQACVDLSPDADLVLWADLDLPQLQAAAWGDLSLELTCSERRLLQVAVQLVDLGAVLRELGGQSLAWVTAAVLAMVGRGDVVDQGEPDLPVWRSPDGGCYATGPLAQALAAVEACGALTGG